MSSMAPSFYFCHVNSSVFFSKLERTSPPLDSLCTSVCFLSQSPRKRSEKAMATHSSTLAWRIPWLEEPGGLQSMGSQRVRHDCKESDMTERLPFPFFFFFFSLSFLRNIKSFYLPSLHAVMQIQLSRINSKMVCFKSSSWIVNCS